MSHVIVHVCTYCSRLVAVPSDANSTIALQELDKVISNDMPKQLDGVFIVAGDLNQTYLRTVVPKFHQHVRQGR